MELTFTIPGDPVPKARPRAFRDSRGNIRTYTPRETRAAEQKAKAEIDARLCRLGIRARPVLGGKPVAVDLVFHLPIPASWPARKRELADGALSSSKPDGDNLAKLILDAMNGVVFADDRQIAGLRVEKRYSKEPRTEIKVREAA